MKSVTLFLLSILGHQLVRVTTVPWLPIEVESHVLFNDTLMRGCWWAFMLCFTCSQMKQKAAEKLCGSYISCSQQPSEGCNMMHWKFIKLTRALCEMSVRSSMLTMISSRYFAFSQTSLLWGAQLIWQPAATWDCSACRSMSFDRHAFYERSNSHRRLTIYKPAHWHAIECLICSPFQ